LDRCCSSGLLFHRSRIRSPLNLCFIQQIQQQLLHVSLSTSFKF
jgi:hypothetical protein